MLIKENQTLKHQGVKKGNNPQKARKNKKRNGKLGIKSLGNSHHRWVGIDFTPVSAEVIFKTTILMMILIVAAVAMVEEITDAAVWAFLTMVAGYAAFSTPRLPENKK